MHAFVMNTHLLSTYNTLEHNKIATVKNWLGRKGLHYSESITEAEKQACNALQGLFDMLATKFWPQFNETKNHCNLENNAEGKMKVQRNGWGSYRWQQ